MEGSFPSGCFNALHKGGPSPCRWRAVHVTGPQETLVPSPFIHKRQLHWGKFLKGPLAFRNTNGPHHAPFVFLIWSNSAASELALPVACRSRTRRVIPIWPLAGCQCRRVVAGKACFHLYVIRVPFNVGEFRFVFVCFARPIWDLSRATLWSLVLLCNGQPRWFEVILVTVHHGWSSGMSGSMRWESACPMGDSPLSCLSVCFRTAANASAQLQCVCHVSGIAFLPAPYSWP